MVQCAIFGCKSNNNKKSKSMTTKKNGNKMNFFGFPKNQAVCKQWLAFCSHKDTLNTENARVCSLHFNVEDYSKRYDLVHNSAHLPSRKTLKPTAIPSRNLPNKIVTSKNDNNALTEREYGQQQLGVNKSNVQMSILLPRQQQQPLVLRENFVSAERKQPLIQVKTEKDIEVLPPPLKPQYVQILLQNVVNNSKNCTINPLEHQQALIRKADEIRQLQAKISKYETEIKSLKREKYLNASCLSSVKAIFTENQVRKLTNPLKKLKWNTDDMSRAIALHKAGPQAYRLLLEQGHPLPALSTIRKWMFEQKTDRKESDLSDL